METLLAQSAPALPSDGTMQFLVTIIGQVGIAGILVWYLYYRTSYADPQRDQTHRETIEEICRSHDEKSAATAKAFTDSLREERDDRRAALKEIRDSFRCYAARPGESGVIR